MGKGKTSLISKLSRKISSSTIGKPSELSPQPYENVLDCVLQLTCTHCQPNYELPWSMSPQEGSGSTAFVIAGRRILTNAHSVALHTNIKLKKRDSDKKFNARLVAIGHECDLALLAVDDEEFWEQFESDDSDHLPYIVPGPLPHLQDPVLCVGYPCFGNQISVTAGITSRVEMIPYGPGRSDLLCVQIDAAINSGNSGGPVLNSDNQVIGIAFQAIDASQAEAIGYIIPFNVVQHFLDDIDTNGRFTGFPGMGFTFQGMENPFIRKARNITEKETGVLVKWVSETADAARVLKRGDIVTHIDGQAVSNVGNVPFRAGERIGMHYAISQKFTGDKVSVTFLRDRVKHTEKYTLSDSGEHKIVKIADYLGRERRRPDYVLFGGLLFQALNLSLMEELFGEDWSESAPTSFCAACYHGKVTSKRREIVVLVQVMVSDCTEGYDEEDEHAESIVNKVNGVPIRGLKHLAELIDKSPSNYVEFDIEGDDTLIIDKRAAKEEEASILATHCINAPRSLSNNP